MKRREALRVLGAAATIPVAAAISARDAHALGARIHRGLARRGELPLDGLTAAQKRTVAALAETIIPETDTLGARTARVDDFIDVLVAEWFDDAERARFVAGVAEVDERARRAFGKAFADGTAAEQTARARELEGEATEARRARTTAPFFAWMKDLTVYGYFTSERVQKEILKHRMFFERYDGCAPA